MKLFIQFVVLSLFISACGAQPSSKSSSDAPNILFVFIDDMGYGDLNSYGNAGVVTPNIDKLGKEGIRFTQFYVNAPICSPSRVAVTTGQYPLRWDITSYLADSTRNNNRGMAQYLDPEAPSLARRLQKAGYYTAHVGKWHMGGQRNVAGAPMISEFGFNSSLTSFEGLGERIGLIFETRDWDGSNRFPLSVQQAKLGRGEVRWVNRHNEPKIFVERALQEIKKADKANQPFYINLWTDAVHTPLEAPPELRGEGSIRAHYFGVIRELDEQLGRVFSYIRDSSELSDNTLVVLSSDNGPSPRIGSSGGLRGQKGNLYEGGIREPFIVWGPGIIDDENTGKVNANTILAGMDLPPSLLAIAGVETSDNVQFDGLDMSKILLGKSDKDREGSVMWVRPPDVKGPNNNWPDLAIREGKWKMLVNIDGSKPELYNLERNPGETINVSKENPQITSNLKKKVLNWFETTKGEISAATNPWEGS